MRNEKNEGIISTCMKGVHRATGDILFLPAADDILLPGFLKQALEVMSQYPELPLCCFDNGLLYEDGRKVVDKTLKGAQETTPLSPSQVIKAIRERDFYIPGHAALFKREAFLECGGYRRELHHACDWFLTRSIALSKGAIYIPGLSAYWRQSHNNYTNTCERDRQMKKEIVFSVLRILSEPQNRYLRHAFRTSTAMHNWLKEFFWSLLFRSLKNYDFLFTTILKEIKRIRKRLYAHFNHSP